MKKRQQITIALRKAKTSLESILLEIEKDNPLCFSIIQQNLAVIGLLKSVNLLMLEGHIEREMSKFSGPQAKQFHSLQKELLKIVKTAQNK